VHAFTRLSKHKQWRASIFGLQAYIKPKVASVGLYTVHEDDKGADLVVSSSVGVGGSGGGGAAAGGTSAPARRNAALDMLCKKLALHLEAACKHYPLRKLVRVYRLVGQFVISEGDERLYLLFPSEVRAQPLEETFATQVRKSWVANVFFFRP
jgi:hypothetical protein